MLHASLGLAPKGQGCGDWVVSHMGPTILTCHPFDTLLIANTSWQHLQTTRVRERGERRESTRIIS